MGSWGARVRHGQNSGLWLSSVLSLYSSLSMRHNLWIRLLGALSIIGLTACVHPGGPQSEQVAVPAVQSPPAPPTVVAEPPATVPAPASTPPAQAATPSPADDAAQGQSQPITP